MKSRQLTRLAFLEEVSGDAFTRAFHSHIEELACERLKDPDYQEWMIDWLDRFAQIWFKKRRYRSAAIGFLSR